MREHRLFLANENDDMIKPFIEGINHKQSFLAALAERKFLNTLEGGCQIPVGCYTEFGEEDFKITGFISMPDSSNLIEGSLTGKKEDAEKIAKTLALSFYEQGARKILEFIREIGDSKQ